MIEFCVDENVAAQRFHKLLVARNSPQNECFAEEGDVLYPPVSNTQGSRSFYFLSATSGRKRSKFGWVRRTAEPFSFDQFLEEHPAIEKNDKQYELLRELLVTIEALPENTPIAGSYFRRGIEQPRVELSFHKVFFYADNSETR